MSMEKAKKYLEAKGGGVRLTVEELESLVGPNRWVDVCKE